MTTGPAGRRRTQPEVVPLSFRIVAVGVVRVALAAILLATQASAGRPPHRGLWVATGVYLLVTAALGAVVTTGRRRLAVSAFGFSLLVDIGYLQGVAHPGPAALPTQLVVAGYLVAVCLLASFRTGVRVAIWNSLVLVTLYQAQQAHLVGPGVPSDRLGLVATLLLTWVVVITASACGAINERELRRRRYDAEALQRFASDLHECERPEEVQALLLRFLVHEVAATRALVCRHDAGAGWQVLAAHRIGPVTAEGAESSALLRLRETGPSLAWRLNRGLDPWLSSVMPDARRLIAARLDDDGSSDTFLVMQHTAQHNRRVERRVVTAIGQAAAIAGLALSRAQLLEQARRAAEVDALTGVQNRRRFEEELQLLGAGRGPFAVIMVDVDHFKAVNDTHGHLVGDQVLQEVATALAGVAGDNVFRYGGEEFAVLLSGRAALEAQALAERLREAVQRVRILPVTASFGVAVAAQGSVLPRDLVSRADEALLQAKQLGRNRVELAQPLPAAR